MNTYIDDELEKIWVVPFWKALWLSLIYPTKWQRIKYSLTYASGRTVTVRGLTEVKK